MSVSKSAETPVAACGDLPAYILRRSDRARHPRLTVTARDGLVVVVPRRLRGYDPAPFLRERATWIARALERCAERRALLSAGPDALLPDEVVFGATGERWVVAYRHTRSRGVRARAAGGVLTLSGAVDDGEACLAALTRWLQAAARERLEPALAEHARTAGLRYERAGVRGQRGRWGSCSAARRTITLNRALLFLPRHLVDAVMLHELAHLIRADHSEAFWRELSALDPHARVHRTQLRDAWRHVPAWAEPAR
jgi:predicted metal-dependent hydrolase